MSEEIEQRLLKENAELHNLVDIEEIFDYSVFDDWFKNEIIQKIKEQ